MSEMGQRQRRGMATLLLSCLSVGQWAERVHSLMSRGEGNELLDGLVLVCGS